MSDQINNPLHGITLKEIVAKLEDYYGWEELGLLIEIRCFCCDPSVKSSLTFLRKTPWARKKVEDLYLVTIKREQRKKRKVAKKLLAKNMAQ